MTTGGQDPNKNPGGDNNEPWQPGGTPPPGGYPPPGSYPPPPPPPPGGSFPPPGGYPPPPPPGGYPPPPPAFDSGYGQQPAGPPPSEVTVGAALSYGWNKFKANPGVWIGVLVVAALISILVSLPFGNNREFEDFSGLVESSFGVWQIIGNIIMTIVGYLISAALIRGALHETDGRPPGFRSFFEFKNVGAIIIASFLVGLMTTVGFVLLIIPGLILAFLTWWTLEFVVDQDQDAITAIKSSFRAISSNWGPLLLLAIALFFLNLVGLLLCLVGLLVTIPVTIIASTYAYRVTVQGPVAP